jgi:hypothetical protein
MITITPVVAATSNDLAADRFWLNLGPYGFPLSISRVKALAVNTLIQQIDPSMLTWFCASQIIAYANANSIAVSAMTLAQMQAAIQTSVVV